MPSIRTLTLNPSIDVSSETDTVRPTHKVRTRNERMDPGGGGINVARVLQRFGVAVEAIYLSGGATGAVLDDLLDQRGIARRVVAIADDTRMSHTVHECSTGLEYRFVPEGPEVSAEEYAAALDAAAESGCDYFVASGSLPGGVPSEIYATLAGRLRPSGARFVLDTSDPELQLALAAGGIFLVKPSKGELELMAGRKLDGRDALVAVARGLVESNKAEHVAVTMGQEGALLANRDGAFLLPAVPVETRSAVGAGDSFLAAMTYGFASGCDALEAFRWGAAAGAATALTPGTDLCFPDDVRRLLEQVPAPERLA